MPQIRQVIPHISDRRCGELASIEQLSQCNAFVLSALNKGLDAQLCSTSLDCAGPATGDDGDVDAVSLQQFDAQAVFDVKRLHLRRFAVAIEQRAVSHDAVDVEHDQLNVFCFLCRAAIHEMPAFNKASRVNDAKCMPVLIHNDQCTDAMAFHQVIASAANMS